MKDSVNRELENWKENYNNLDIDLDEIDHAIESGFSKAKGRPSRWKPFFMSALTAAAILLFSFVALVNFSSTFSEQVSKVSGLGELADLVSRDKGLQSAYEEGYAENIGVSERQGNFELTIDDVVKDQFGMVIFYTLKSEDPVSGLKLDEVELTTQQGEELPIGSSGMSFPGNSERKEYSSTIEYFFTEPIKSEKFVLNANISEHNQEFSIEFETKNNAKPVTYDINKTVSIEGQKIIVNSVTINPIRTSVEIQHVEGNNMKILNIDDFKLVDGKGEVWNGITNGTTKSGPNDEGLVTYYLQSNYFEKPQELYLEFSKAQAVPKGEGYMKFDVNNEKILFDPYNKFYDFEYDGHGSISLSMDKIDEYYSSPFTKFYDEDGNELDNNSSSHMSDDQNKIDTFKYVVGKVDGIIKAELSSYPHWIEEDVRIRIK
ncbi:DUF4179 domain-containing protein [Filobacillus milosensis]|uniref:DUF4179 domain-containing protein n=1 Tax=Filobacillus milosensis TaxID=94137 RepID=A0A4Y8IRM8_9BACI|nr:DUF4179 domain-containing protein [Filobacillus milosensis]TFB23328.1 DUF4179 domain-containing protein [Filobacillus milosensis]